MAVFTSIYDPMNEEKKKMIKDHQELLTDMLDFAIQELESIAEDNEIYLIDNMKVCKDYQSIFDCLKHQALKRQGNK